VAWGRDADGHATFALRLDGRTARLLMADLKPGQLALGLTPLPLSGDDAPPPVFVPPGLCPGGPAGLLPGLTPDPDVLRAAVAARRAFDAGTVDLGPLPL
jgi:hypothetical protein